MSPVPGELAVLRAANAELRQVIEAKDAEITVLRAQVEELRTQVEELAARVQANSKNSSRPPSSDGLGRPAPKALRKKTGRGPGRPKGQPGVTLGLSDWPDHVIRHEPGGCGGCGTGLSAAEEAGVERRQVIDVPPVRPEITEHQIIARRCGCGKVTRGQAPEGVTAPGATVTGQVNTSISPEATGTDEATSAPGPAAPPGQATSAARTAIIPAGNPAAPGNVLTCRNDTIR